MLAEHFAAVENQLLATSRIPANAGHTLHRGTPREAFIRQFLTGHLSARAAVGTGEIIDANSQAREQRNQFDIVVYNADFPKIDLGGGINAFLAEAVIATVEVKSLLTYEELATAVASAARAKRLQRNLVTSFRTGHVPPGILSFVVAYDGPAHSETFFRWLVDIEKEQGLNTERLPPTGNARAAVLSQSLEGVFVLGKGSVVFDNGTVGVVSDANRTTYPAARFQYIDSASQNLMWQFLLLTNATSNTVAQWPNLERYFAREQFPNVRFGP